MPTFGEGAPRLLREASRALRLGHAGDDRIADALPAYRESVQWFFREPVRLYLSADPADAAHSPDLPSVEHQLRRERNDR